MGTVVNLVSVEAQPLEVVRGQTSPSKIPATIRILVDRFYANVKDKTGLDTVLYP